MIIKRKKVVVYANNNKRHNWGGELTFTASPATIDIPTGKIILEDNMVDQNYSLTIPSGVKVLEVYLSIDSLIEGAEGVLYISNNKSDKTWADVTGWWEDGFPDDITNYVGVTPGKTYSLIISMDVDGSSSGYIAYSPTINTYTPVVTDY